MGDIQKGEMTREELLDNAKIKNFNPNASIELFKLDLSTYSSVFSFAKELSARVNTLDAATLNVGACTFKFMALATERHNDIAL